MTKNKPSGKVHVKTGDTVVVISGKEKGKKGKISGVSRKEGKVTIEGVNLVSKHVKPKKAGQEGGIIKAEGPMYSSKVQLVCPHCSSKTRISHSFLEDGKKVRICKKCKKTL